MKITPKNRKKLVYYLTRFYEIYSREKYTIFHFVKFFKKRLKDERKDAWMAVVGNTSVGKSLFVLMSMILFGRPVDLKKNVSYIPKGDEILEKFMKLSFQCFLVDESAREMRAVNWQSKKQQQVNVLAMTERFKNNWVFLNMPNFKEFTKSMKQSNLMFRAIIPYRNSMFARVIIQRKSRNWRSDDVWDDTKTNDIYEKVERKKGELSDDDILSIERKSSSYVMDFIVPNLEVILPEITSEYERLKHESRVDMQEEEFKADGNVWLDKYKELMVKVTKILYYNNMNLGKIKISQKELASALGVSTMTFKKYLDAEEKKESFADKRKDMVLET